jgi:Xaa-Pro dipeptidase
MATTTITLPSQADYDNRISRGLKEMERLNIDLLALAGVDINRFFTGMHGLPSTRPIWFVLFRDRNNGFVSPTTETGEIAARCNTPVIEEWAEWQKTNLPTTHQDALAQCIKKHAPNARKIGVDFNGTSGLNIELVKTTLGSHRVQDVTSLVLELFAIKDAPALAIIRHSCNIAEAMYTATLNTIQLDIPAWELALASFTAGTRKTAQLWGGNQEQSPLAHGLHMTAIGRKQTARCHAPAGGQTIQNGDLVQVCRCSTGIYGHLIGFDRPIYFGKNPMPNEMRKLVDLARNAQEAALQAARTARTFGDIDKAVTTVIKISGYKPEDVLLHRTGRTIGYSASDGDDITAQSTTLIRDNMVFTIEPGLYDPEIGGARYGDTVRSIRTENETDIEILTPYDLGRYI